MKYRAIAHFKDKQDNNHEYQAGDIFPRPGKTVSEERIRSLAGTDNVRGTAVIEAVDLINPPEKPKEEPKEALKPKRGRKKANA